MSGSDGQTATGAKYARLYRVTAIARPLDPSFPTNRAVLILLPLAAAAGAGYSLATGAGSVLSLALVAAAVAFGAWALARELAPDDNPAAFAAMALAMAGLAVWPSPGVALLFTALLLARLVNRTTGLAARPVDVVLILALVLWAAWSTASPLLLATAALAFVFDAVLAAPARRHLLAAGLALVAALWLGSTTGLTTHDLGGTAAWTVAAIVLMSLWHIVSMRHIDAPCDVTGTANSPERVKAGVLVALLVAGQALIHGNDGIAMASPLWATLAACAVAARIPRGSSP